MRLEWKLSTIRLWLRFESKALPGSVSDAHEAPGARPATGFCLWKCEAQGSCRTVVGLRASLRPDASDELGRALWHAAVRLFCVDNSRTHARLRTRLSQGPPHGLLFGEGELEPQHSTAARQNGLRL